MQFIAVLIFCGSLSSTSKGLDNGNVDNNGGHLDCPRDKDLDYRYNRYKRCNNGDSPGMIAS